MLLPFTGCIHTNPEERCLRANLDIDSLTIETTYYNDSKTTVQCSGKESVSGGD